MPPMRRTERRTKTFANAAPITPATPTASQAAGEPVQLAPSGEPSRGRANSQMSAAAPARITALASSEGSFEKLVREITR